MIDARPKVVEDKYCIGDWEMDTIIGSHHRGAIITVVERKSKYYYGLFNSRQQRIKKSQKNYFYDY
jgi:IS30 family transposase